MSRNSDVDPCHERVPRRKGLAESKKAITNGDQSASGLEAQNRSAREIDERLKSLEKHTDEAQPSKKGVNRIAKRYLASLHWNDTKLRTMERDGYRCQACARGLDDVLRHRVHHIYPLKEYICDGFDPEAYPEGLLATLCDSCHRYSEERPGLLKVPQKYPMANYNRMGNRHGLASHHSKKFRRLQDACDSVLASRGIEILRWHTNSSSLPSKLPKSADQESINRMNDSMKEFMVKLLEEVRKERQRIREFRIDGKVRNPNKQLSPTESSGIPEDWKVPFAKLDRMVRDELDELDFELYGLRATLRTRDESKDSGSGDDKPRFQDQ